MLRFHSSIHPGTKSGIHRRSVLWLILAICCLVAKEVLPEVFWEIAYYKGIFKAIRVVYDYTLGWLPFPMIYVVVGIALFRTGNWIADWNRGALFQWSRAIGGISALIMIFYFTWGFNYGQVPLVVRQGFDFSSVGPEQLIHEFGRASDVLQREAENLPEVFTTDVSIRRSPVVDRSLRDDVEQALSLLSLPHAGRVRVRRLWPNGILLRLSTAGIYIPHAFEGHIDKGLLSVQQPFTMAHEMAHGYGVADEGACNFIAWLACSQSKDPWVRFGGALTYWRYVAAEMDADTVSARLNTMPAVVLRSMKLVRENDHNYPDIMPHVRDAIYSSYLKNHGVKHGLRSYNEVVVMVQQYLQRNPSTLRPMD